MVTLYYAKVSRFSITSSHRLDQCRGKSSFKKNHSTTRIGVRKTAPISLCSGLYLSVSRELAMRGSGLPGDNSTRRHLAEMEALTP